jgi:hypothetical protein
MSGIEPTELEHYATIASLRKELAECKRVSDDRWEAASKALREAHALMTTLRKELVDMTQERDEAVRWIGVVCEELVIAGYTGGDRATLLRSLRAALSGSQKEAT